MKPIMLRILSSVFVVPCLAAYYYRWSFGIVCALLVVFAFSNYVDGYETAKAMMRKVWKLK